MNEFNNVLVPLDHSENDTNLIKAASYMAALSNSKEVCFINIIKDVQIPEQVQKEFPEMVQNALSEREREISQSVKQHFSCSEVNINIKIIQGQPTKVIMNYCKEQSTDLIIMGRKNKYENGHALVNRLARRALCSLLIIPGDFRQELNKVLVPIDFSDYAKGAMLQAINLVERQPKAQIFAQNVFRVPTGYHYSGKSYEEFSVIMQKNSEKDFKAFMSPIDAKGVQLEPIYTLDENDSTVDAIHNAALGNNVDVIMIGAKGRTAATALFIGSSAEELIHKESEIPLMVVRPKGEQAGLIDYIKEI